MKYNTKSTVISSMLAAVIFVLTRFVSVPTVTSVGNVNLGDCAVLLAAWLLPLHYAFLSAGVGSALADLLSPYSVYTPATFLIKGLMAVTASVIFNRIKLKSPVAKAVVSGLAAELIMITGYLLFEGIFICGFKTALLNIPFNAVQGAVGLACATLLSNALKRK